MLKKNIGIFSSLFLLSFLGVNSSFESVNSQTLDSSNVEITDTFKNIDGKYTKEAYLDIKITGKKEIDWDQSTYTIVTKNYYEETEPVKKACSKNVPIENIKLNEIKDSTQPTCSLKYITQVKEPGLLRLHFGGEVGPGSTQTEYKFNITFTDGTTEEKRYTLPYTRKITEGIQTVLFSDNRVGLFLYNFGGQSNALSHVKYKIIDGNQTCYESDTWTERTIKQGYELVDPSKANHFLVNIGTINENQKLCIGSWSLNSSETKNNILYETALITPSLSQQIYQGRELFHGVLSSNVITKGIQVGSLTTFFEGKYLKTYVYESGTFTSPRRWFSLEQLKEWSGKNLWFHLNLNYSGNLQTINSNWQSSLENLNKLEVPLKQTLIGTCSNNQIGVFTQDSGTKELKSAAYVDNSQNEKIAKISFGVKDGERCSVPSTFKSTTSNYNILIKDQLVTGYEGNRPFEVPRVKEGTLCVVYEKASEPSNIYTCEIDEKRGTLKDEVLGVEKNPPVITPTIDYNRKIIKATITDESELRPSYYYWDYLGETSRVPYRQPEDLGFLDSHCGNTLVFIAEDIHRNKSKKEVPINCGPSDKIPPIITLKTSTPDRISSNIRDDSNTTCEYWYKDTPTTKYPYTSGQEITIKKEHHGKTIVFSCIDEHGNGPTTAEAPLVYSDLEAPVITPKTDVKDKVSATITDTNNVTCQYWYKDNEAQKFPYTSGTEINITREHHGKTIIFSCIDEHNNGPTVKEVPLTFSDITGPNITPKNDTPNKVSATITDLGNGTCQYWYKDNVAQKFTYTTGQEIDIKKTDHGKTIVFSCSDEHGNTTQKEVSLTFSDLDAPVITPKTDVKDKVSATITDKSPITSTYHWEDTPDQKIPYTSGQEIDIPRDKDGKKIIFTSTDAHGNGPTVKEVPVSFSDTKGPDIVPNTAKQNTVKATITDDNNFTAKTWLKDTPDNKTPYISDTELPITPDQNGKIRVYEAVDEHGNRTEKEVPLVYVDNLPPVIIPDTSIPDNVRAEITDDTPTTNTYHYKDTPNDKTPYTSNDLIPITRNDHGRTIVFTAIDAHGNKTEREVILNFSDTTGPDITPKTDIPNKVSATVTDLGNGTCQYWFKDNETQKFAYTPEQEISIKRNDHGKTIIFSCVDDHGNKTEKEVTLTFSDIEGPVITPNTSKKDIVSATITDKSPTTGTYYFKDTPNTKLPYVSLQEIPVTRDMHDKTIVFEAIDEHGNQAKPKEVKLSFSDINGPEITINQTKKDIVSASITDDNTTTSTYYYKDTSNEKFPYTSNKEIPVTRNDHGRTIVFEAVDKFGNQATPKEALLSYSDTQGPVLTVDQTKKDIVTTTITDDGEATGTYYFKDEPTVKKTFTGKVDLPITRKDHGRIIVFEGVDEHGNKAETKEVTLKFSDIEAPVISNTFDPITRKGMISATDASDFTITYRIGNGADLPILSGTEVQFNYNDLGKTVTITAIDIHGNKSTKEFTLTRKESSTIGGIIDTPKVEQKEEIKKEEVKEEKKVESKEKIKIIVNRIEKNSSSSLGNQCKGLKQVFTEDQLQFKDIANSEFSKYIKVVGMYRGDVNVKTYEGYGVVNNVENYNPNRQITRAEYVKMIVRALACNFKTPENIPVFKDVDQAEWYAEYINFAVNEGWVNGYADGTFRPNEAITRQEAAKILVNAAKLNIDNTAVYSDVQTNSEFAKYISTLKVNNIVSSTDKFNPEGKMSRGEFAKVVANVLMKQN